MIDFDEWYREWFPKLRDYIYYNYHYCISREDAEDVAQEAFCRAIERWDTYEGRDGCRPASWLYTIAANYAIDQYVRKPYSRRKREHLLEQSNKVDWEPSADALIDALRALDDLSSRQKEVVVMIDRLYYTPEQAGQVLGIGYHATKALLYRARQNLRKATAEA